MTRFGYTLMTGQPEPASLVRQAAAARYHPAVVAQKASTITVLSDGRFSIGVGCGGGRADMDAVVDSVRRFWQAGFTDIALVQVGDDSTTRFLREATQPLLAKLRAAAQR